MRAKPAEKLDFQVYYDMLRNPKELKQILVPVPGYSSAELAKLLSSHVRSIQNANRYLTQELTSLRIERKQIRGKLWNDLDDEIRRSLIREYMGPSMKQELETYERTNVSLRREVQRLHDAISRGLCERG